MKTDNRRSRCMKKLPPSYGPIVMPLILSVLMSAIVSAVATLVHVGGGAVFLAKWPGAWAASWIVAYPSLLIVLPVVRRVMEAIVATPGSRA